MNILYGKSWFRAKQCFTESWNEVKASKAHSMRHPYAVLIEEMHKKICFIEFNNDYVGVGFLDQNGREYASYQFQELESERLFLSMATHRRFEKSAQVCHGTTYYFKPTGLVTIEEIDISNENKSSSQSLVDVSINWEKYPSFGDYLSITRFER